MSFDPPGYPPSVSIDMEAYTDLPGHHLRSTLDLLATSPTSEHMNSEEEDSMDFGLDFSGLRNADSTRHFLFACDYYLSDGLQQALEQEKAGRALGKGARIKSRDVHRCIIEDAGAEQPPIFNRASKNLAAVAILLRTMP
jgi:hypothetical protein